MESEHRVAWCTVRPEGSVDGPDPELPVFARSAVKPLQALGGVRSGVLERFGLGERHLALACASHGGSEVHVSVVAEILAACGLVEAALGCGPELPLDPRAARGGRGSGTTAPASTRSGSRAAWPRSGRSTATSAAATGSSARCATA